MHTNRAATGACLHMLWLCVLLASRAIAVTPTQSFDQDWRWVNFTTEAGLPSNHIYDVAETSEGTVWVATAGGIAWYDGYRWMPIDTAVVPAGRPSVFCVDLDNQLILVVNTQLYQGNREGFTRPLSVNIHEAVPFGKDSLLVIANGPYLFLYSAGSMKPFPPYDFVNKIWRTPGGSLWLNTFNALYRWERGAWALKVQTTAPRLKLTQLLENEQGLGIASVSLPFEMWGIWGWRKGKKPSMLRGEEGTSFKSATINSTDEVIAVHESGLLRKYHDGEWSKVDLAKREIRDIEFARFRPNGDLWIGTQHGLFLYRLSSKRWTYLKHQSPDPRNSVNEIIKTRNGDLWLATSKGIEIHKENGRYEFISHIHGNPLFVVTGLIEDSDGNVWVSSGGGFDGAYRWDGKTWIHIAAGTPLEGNRIHKIRTDRRGRLWFLAIWPTRQVPDSLETLGAFVYENGTFTGHWSPENGLPHKRVYSFAEGRDGAFWFGTFAGLARWKNGRWTYWKYNESNNRVFTLSADSVGRIWFGGTQHGLGYVDEEDSVHIHTVADGLVNDEVWDIQTDKDGKVWIATSGGLSSFHNGVWTSMDSRNGLLSSELWPVAPIGEKIYAGSRGSGVSILDLATDSLFTPIISIERSATQGRTAILQWKTLAFWGDPSPQDISTRYRIDNGKWSRWSVDHSVTIQDLSPGEHTFQVQAIGPFGSPSLKVQSATFIIETPLVKHPLVLFPSGALLLLGLAFVFTVYARKRKHDAELRESEMKFRVITETTSSAIFIYNEMQILFVNHAAELLTGCPADILIGRPFLDFVHPDSKEEFGNTSLLFVKAEQGTVRSELKFMKPSGEVHWVDYTEGRIDFHGRQATVGTAVDISERKKAEEKILANQEQLRLLASELSSTEERERRRMATFLHDSIGQTLAVCKIKLGQLQQGAASAGLSGQLNEIRSFIEQSIHNTRSLTFELSPPTLHELGLVTTLEWLAEQMQIQHNLKITVEGEKGKIPLTDDKRAVLFHATRELLVNAVKHASATSIVIMARKDDRNFYLVVSDDGIGQDLKRVKMHQSKNGGFGLFNIRERITHLNGRMEIVSSPGKGTRVELIAPLDQLNDPATIGDAHG